MSFSGGSSYSNSEVNMNFTAKLGQVTSVPHRSDLETQIDSSNANNELLFFNYHEYIIAEYTDLATNITKVYDQPIVVNHFPNSYVPLNSPLYKTTRIVRIPRIFNFVEGNVYPQFSLYLPGQEPAALTSTADDSSDDVDLTFLPRGKYLGNIFGYNSVTPLSNYLTSEEFHTIVNEINSKLKSAFNPFSFINICESLVDFLTFSVFSYIKSDHCSKTLIELESLISTINATIEHKGIKIISPKSSGYLSLDIQIPKPSTTSRS